MLAGSEVKSIRPSRANLQDAYAGVEEGEVWLCGMHILAEFSTGELDPVRRRKLLDARHHGVGEALLEVAQAQPSGGGFRPILDVAPPTSASTSTSAPIAALSPAT